MYPKLNNEPVALSINEKTFIIPRKTLASAFAGALAAKSNLLWESIPLTRTGENFKSRYQKVMPSCISAANFVGLSATMETLEYWRPGKEIDQLLKDRIEHTDNPFYPFLEED
jgi:hypothetical protein